MSETLAEEEKRRIRVELLTEIAKNEQDLEQCNEETGRYGRELLYNIRDLEQLCSITECPLTSHELKEFGIFPKKKNLLNRAWKHVKVIVTQPHKAEEEAARNAREKAEIEDRMNRLEEHSRRSEEARIERDRIVEEQTERQREKEEKQTRENAAHLEKERTEKAELEARIKMMEEQMRRSEEARIKMERWIEEEKKRKMVEEEERRIREEEARIEKEKAEAEVRKRKEEDNRCIRLRETSANKIQNYYRGWRLIVKAKEELNERRKRKEKERIEKEEEDRERKVEVERRLRIEADVKSLLALPYELRVQAYRDFNLEKRRELRINEELAEIELKTEYQYNTLYIERKEDHVELIIWNEPDNEQCYDKVSIPISKIEKELEIMGKNTQLDCIIYTANSGDQQIINGMKSLKSKKVDVYSVSNLDDADLRSIVENTERLTIWSSSSITVNGLMWIYENMRDGQFELNKTHIYVPDEVRWNFLDKFGNFNRESLTFTGTNHNQEVTHDDEDVIIEQGELKIFVSKKDNRFGSIRFRIDF